MSLYDMHQRQQIRGANVRASGLEHSLQATKRRTDNEFEELHTRLEKLTALTESMWLLLTEVSGLTDEHLAYKLYELDVKDGTRDEKKSVMSMPCASARCDAMVNPRARICQFCGTDAPARSPFDKI